MLSTLAKPRRLTISLSLIALLTLLHAALHTTLPHIFIHPWTQCSHTILISQARHGTTWLLDSVERCRFSRKEQVEEGIYGKRVYLDTELWHVYDKAALYNISAQEAVNYVMNNCSVKIFPTALEKLDRFKALVKGGRDLHVPIVVLRRNLTDAFWSYRRAEQSGVWAHVNQGGAEAAENMGATQQNMNDPATGRALAKWRRESNVYFARVNQLLEKLEVPVDELWYENVTHAKWLYLHSGSCWVRSCNYV